MSWINEVVYPRCTIKVIGGIHASLKPDEVINEGFFDLLCTGEAEVTFQEIIDRVESNSRIDDIVGTWFFDKEKYLNSDFFVLGQNIKKNERRQLLSANDLWKYDPDFDLYKSDSYFERPFDGKTVRRYDIETARGCPYHCAYCGNSALKDAQSGCGPFTKDRPIDSSFRHLKMMKNKYNIELISFMDECFLAHPNKKIKEFAIRYKEEIRLPFIFQTRHETVTEKRLQLLELFGAPYQASIGVESGNDEILKNVCERTCKTRQVIEAFDLLHKYKVRTNAFFMVGLPYETRATTFDTIKLARRIKPTVQSVAIFQPLPGQNITDRLLEEGIINEEDSRGSNMHTFTSGTTLKQQEPYLQQDEITNLRRVFSLYSTLPEEYWEEIKKCEDNIDDNKSLFNELVKLRWEKYDYSLYRNEMDLLRNYTQ